MNGIRTLTNKTVQQLRDALAHRGYSRDFAYMRSEYLRSRAMMVCVLFLILMPFWTLLDWVMLPEASLPYTMAGRIAMVLTLLLVLALTRPGRHPQQRTCPACGMLLVAPAAFYALVLSVTPPGGGALIGYNFIPYMLVAMLAIFPFTLLESAVLGLALIALQVFALHTAGTLMTLAGLQDLWLLAALLSIALSANYFQLALMLQLHREATHDPLTGLLNRGALLRSMARMTARQPAPRAALLMLDLDHFKRINDQYGHMAGDDVLKHFTRQLTQTLRPADIAARYGGEEFIAVLIDADQDSALEIAERIRHHAETSAVEDGQGNAIRYTVSIGIAMLNPGDSLEEVIKAADNRLYEAKRQARNRVVAV